MNENCIDRYISVILPLYVFYTIRTIQMQVRKKELNIINWNLMMYDVLCMMMQVDAGI